MTKLIDIFEAAIDNALANEIDLSEFSARDFESYSEGAMDIYISNEKAELMASCMNDFCENGQGSNDYFHMVESKLQGEVE